MNKEKYAWGLMMLGEAIRFNRDEPVMKTFKQLTASDPFTEDELQEVLGQRPGDVLDLYNRKISEPQPEPHLDSGYVSEVGMRRRMHDQAFRNGSLG